MAESEEELKSSCWMWKRRVKAGLKLSIQKTKIMASSPITSWQIDGEEVETVSDFILTGSKITAMVTAAMKLKDACSLEEKLWHTRQCIKKQRHYFAHKDPYSQGYGFPSSHVWMWKLYHSVWLSAKESMLSNCGAREDSWESFGQ